MHTFRLSQLSLYLLICMVGTALPAFSFAQTPNDPYAEQWAYIDTGVYEAWDTSTGSQDVVVAVIDNGFDTFHPDFEGNVWKNTKEVPDNLRDDDNNGYVDDVWGWNFVAEDINNDGYISDAEEEGSNDPRPRVHELSLQEKEDGVVHHGTVVAGIIGAVGNNKKAGVGINWNVKLMNLRLLDETGRGGVHRLGDAIRYAVDNGADIINLSVVSDGEDTRLTSAIDYAYDNGVAIIAAAGNTNTFLNSSAYYPVCSDAGDNSVKVLGISAIDENHHKASFSNYGSDCIDMTAPGYRMGSSVYYDPSEQLEELYQKGWSGTSFAAPMVSGAAALIKAIQPTWDADQIYEALLSTTHKTPPDDEEAYAHLFGKGLLQIDQAVVYALSEKPKPAAPSPDDSIGIGLANLENGIISRYIGDTEYIRHSQSVNDAFTLAATSEGLPKQYAVSTFSKSSGALIHLFDSEWKRTGHFTVDVPGALDVALADVDSQHEGVEVIVTPSYPSTELYRIYTLEGTLLYTKTAEKIHNGGVVTVVHSSDTTRDIVTAHKTADGTVRVRHFSHTHDVLRDFMLEYTQDVSDIAVGDVNANGTLEYVVAPGNAAEPWVAIYTEEGNFFQRLAVYTPTFHSDLTLMLQDYDGDGDNDIVVAPIGLDAPLRVWNTSGKKLLEWMPYNRPENSSVHVFQTAR